jgi:hypothetical protein
VSTPWQLIIGAILKGVSDTASAVGTGLSSTSEAWAAESEAWAADYNAAAAEYRGKYTKQAAKIAEKDLRESVRRTVGTATAAAGASGFTTGSGSNQDAIDAIVRSGELDAAMIRFAGDIGSWETTNEATLNREKARQYRAAAKSMRAVGNLNVVSTLFGGAGDAVMGGFFKKK